MKTKKEAKTLYCLDCAKKIEDKDYKALGMCKDCGDWIAGLTRIDLPGY